MRWTVGRWPWAPRHMVKWLFQQQSLLCNPRLDGASVQLVEVLSTPSQQSVGPLSASLHSMTRGDVCIGALHAFGARCVHPSLASGVFSALIRRQDVKRRRGPTQPIYRQSKPQLTSPSGSARREALFRLRHSRGGNKRRGILQYYNNTVPERNATFIKRRRKYIRRDGGRA